MFKLTYLLDFHKHSILRKKGNFLTVIFSMFMKEKEANLNTFFVSFFLRIQGEEEKYFFVFSDQRVKWGKSTRIHVNSLFGTILTGLYLREL